MIIDERIAELRQELKELTQKYRQVDKENDKLKIIMEELQKGYQGGKTDYEELIQKHKEMDEVRSRLEKDLDQVQDLQ